MSLRKGAGFTVIPAIDLRAGRVVRLEEGDFGRERIYADDPAEVAAGFGAAGATWIHVVDLDGARVGERRQATTIAALRSALRPATRLQVGGGIRSDEAVAETLTAGADRVVIGTAAIDDPELVGRAVDRHGSDRLAVALDVRDGQAIGHGWVPGAPARPVASVVGALRSAGIRTFVVTAIDHDGLLGGPDLELLELVLRLTDADVIASGGIATIENLMTARALGCRGAIVGRALYERRIDLAEALAVGR